ncbi:MAG: leucine-rich repeat protein [Alloprevotella sp.]|nr:leucine-rich repeat protein [Alloprevotella sp.]
MATAILPAETHHVNASFACIATDKGHKPSWLSFLQRAFPLTEHHHLGVSNLDLRAVLTQPRFEPAAVTYDGTTYSVTSIGWYAFYDCTGLTSITIPNSVTTIGDYAFQYCTGLTSITIPNSVTSIGSSAFDGCTGLTSINIPNSVTSIGSYAFDGSTGLTSINIPNSVTSIGDYAFYGCTGLTDIYALRTTPSAYNCDTSAFFDVPTSTCTLHVPKGSKEAYKAIEPWNQFENIVEDAKPSTEPADLNGDGSVNVGDVTTLVNMILGKAEKSEAADLNGDGSVNVGDVTTLVNKILGK